MGFGQTAVPHAEQINAVAELLRRAAEANMALFESTTPQGTVDRTGYSMDVVKQMWMDWEPSYANALLASTWYGNLALQDKTDDEIAQALINLGASLTAWGESALLIAKYYSLGAELDEDGNLTGLAAESALLEMLDLAEDRAAELTALVADEEPVAPLGYAQVARVWRQGTPEEQLLALYYNWQAVVESQVLAYLTGNYGEAVLEEMEKSGRPVRELDYWDFSAQ